MRGNLTRRWLPVLLVLAAAAQAAAAERGWRTLSTPHYQVLSQLGDRETLTWAREFDQFIASMSGVLRIDPASLPPLTVMLFARDRTFTPYKMARPDGRTANVDGLFVRRPTWSVIGLTFKPDDQYLRELIFHEATHWLMSVDESRRPAWFSEGIAELLSTFEFRGGQINWAKPVAARLETLRLEGLLPLRDFLASPYALFDRDEHTDRFYAQAWGFTHFLLYSGNDARAQALVKFLDTYKTSSGEATVDTVFGDGLPELERQFRQYVDQPTWRYSTGASTAVAPPPPLQAASAAFVESALGFLALGAGRGELARTHARKTLELDPAAPRGHEILAYLAVEAGEEKEAATHAEAALQRGSRDSDMFVMRAEAWGNDPGAARQVADLYQGALELSPRRLELYSLLAGVATGLDQPNALDARFLRQGIARFPGEDWLRVGAAAIDRQQGRQQEAFEAMSHALRPESTLDERQRDFAVTVHRAWRMEDMTDAVNDAMGRRDVATARAAIETTRPHATGNARAEQFLRELEGAVTRFELMERLGAAQRTGRRAEVRALAEQILALPDVPPEMRDYLNRLRSDGRPGN